jgi:hypothetical protein
MRFLVLGGLLIGGWVVGAAVEDFSPMAPSARPKCEKATRTLFWPEEANRDARAAVQLAREGRLLICTRGGWKYGWRPVAVNVREAEQERTREKK